MFDCTSCRLQEGDNHSKESVYALSTYNDAANVLIWLLNCNVCWC